MDLGVSGLASGFDWRTFVDQIVEVERAPQRSLLIEQNQIEIRKNAYGTIKTQLAVLQNRLAALKEVSLFDSRSASVSNEDLASVTAAAGAPLGSFTFNFTQLAAAAKLNGTANIGRPIHDKATVATVALSSAGFATAITAGTFTVNGAQIAIDSDDTLGDVFDKIRSATGNVVTATYTPTTDTISLTTANTPIVLGSATDTSNFLQVARLYNNGTKTTTSTGSLGSVKTTATLANGNFTTAITNGGTGPGSFKVNGVEITFDAAVDTLNDVITRINNSDAGVLASYDSVNDRVVLSNRETGDIGISVQHVKGNFATATGLATATLERGKDLLYTVNGSGTLVSRSNVITQESSGIAGLNVTALAIGSVTVSSTSDTEKVKNAIKGFIEEYNKAQSILDTNTASSTDAKGKVTAGTLAGDSEANELASRLRSLAYGAISALALDMNQLADLGIETNGNNNNLELKDEALLDRALATDLTGVKALFTDETNGLAVRLDDYLEKTIGEDGTFADKDAKLSKEIAGIDTQISDLERIVESNRLRLIDSFIAMETAQAQINQQLQFLMQRFGGSTAPA